MGIQPKTLGFAIATIKLKFEKVKHSTILVLTIKGSLKASCKYISFRKQIYIVEIPSNMVGEFEMHCSLDHTVKVNGKKISTSFGTIRLTPVMNTIELPVNTFFKKIKFIARQNEIKIVLN